MSLADFKRSFGLQLRKVGLKSTTKEDYQRRRSKILADIDALEGWGLDVRGLRKKVPAETVPDGNYTQAYVDLAALKARVSKHVQDEGGDRFAARVKACRSTAKQLRKEELWAWRHARTDDAYALVIAEVEADRLLDSAWKGPSAAAQLAAKGEHSKALEQLAVFEAAAADALMYQQHTFDVLNVIESVRAKLKEVRGSTYDWETRLASDALNPRDGGGIWEANRSAALSQLSELNQELDAAMGQFPTTLAVDDPFEGDAGAEDEIADILKRLEALRGEDNGPVEALRQKVEHLSSQTPSSRQAQMLDDAPERLRTVLLEARMLEAALLKGREVEAPPERVAVLEMRRETTTIEVQLLDYLGQADRSALQAVGIEGFAYSYRCQVDAVQPEVQLGAIKRNMFDVLFSKLPLLLAVSREASAAAEDGPPDETTCAALQKKASVAAKECWDACLTSLNRQVKLIKASEKEAVGVRAAHNKEVAQAEARLQGSVGFLGRIDQFKAIYGASQAILTIVAELKASPHTVAAIVDSFQQLRSQLEHWVGELAGQMDDIDRELLTLQLASALKVTAAAAAGNLRHRAEVVMTAATDDLLRHIDTIVSQQTAADRSWFGVESELAQLDDVVRDLATTCAQAEGRIRARRSEWAALVQEAAGWVSSIELLRTAEPAVVAQELERVLEEVATFVPSLATTIGIPSADELEKAVRPIRSALSLYASADGPTAVKLPADSITSVKDTAVSVSLRTAERDALHPELPLRTLTHTLQVDLLEELGSERRDAFVSVGVLQLAHDFELTIEATEPEVQLGNIQRSLLPTLYGEMPKMLILAGEVQAFLDAGRPEDQQRPLLDKVATTANAIWPVYQAALDPLVKRVTAQEKQSLKMVKAENQRVRNAQAAELPKTMLEQAAEVTALMPTPIGPVVSVLLKTPAFIKRMRQLLAVRRALKAIGTLTKAAQAAAHGAASIVQLTKGLQRDVETAQREYALASGTPELSLLVLKLVAQLKALAEAVWQSLVHHAQGVTEPTQQLLTELRFIIKLENPQPDWFGPLRQLEGIDLQIGQFAQVCATAELGVLNGEAARTQLVKQMEQVVGWIDALRDVEPSEAIEHFKMLIQKIELVSVELSPGKVAAEVRVGSLLIEGAVMTDALAALLEQE